MAAKQTLSRSLSAATRFLRPAGGRSLHQNRLVFPTEGLALPTGNLLLERLRSLNAPRLHLDTLLMSPKEARKILHASRMAEVRASLRARPEGSISYPEFLHICGDRGAEPDHGASIAKALDESGDVIVLGDLVLLCPDQVARAIQGVIYNSAKKRPNDGEAEAKELRKLEKMKAEIDAKAEAGVRKELRWGLALLATQTIGFMRLTFWELSWDVMEPVCFYVTSLYFMLGYAFFLRTAREPSFEGFFEARFASRQRRFLEAAGFDLHRFHLLRRSVHGDRVGIQGRIESLGATRSNGLSYHRDDSPLRAWIGSLN